MAEEKLFKNEKLNGDSISCEQSHTRESSVLRSFDPIDRDRIEADLWALAAFNATPSEGVTRLPFTKEAREACEYLKRRFSEAGLETFEDSIGNVIGVLPGKNRELPAVAMGSHYDTVYNGGMFDGQAGIAAALEIARCIKERGIELERDLVVIAFNDEEGVRFHRSYLGSYGILGVDQQEALKAYRDRDGISIYEAMLSYGMRPEDIGSSAWDMKKIRAFIELHIEQGPVLDTEGLKVGIVQSVVGFRRYMISIRGQADHSGTAPMELRQDAVDAASRVAAWMGDFARSRKDGTVATAGYWRVSPSVENIVPELCEFSAEVRSENTESLDAFSAGLMEQLRSSCEMCRTKFEVIKKMDIPPVKLSQDLCGRLEQSCRSRGLPYKRMHSGAGHDAQEIAHSCETVMIFAPSRGGRSHCREEWTDFEDIACASAAAYDLILSLQV